MSNFELQLRDPSIVYYGPHACEICGTVIVKMGREWGGTCVDMPPGPVYPNSEWHLHVCSQPPEPMPSLKPEPVRDKNDLCGMEYTVYSVRGSTFSRLLGKVLDVLALSLPNKQQHQAAVHTVRKAFDGTYFDMLRQTYSEVEFGTDAEYSVEPMR
jgi:hypothetical protein